MSKIFADIRFVSGVLKWWCCSQLLHGSFQPGNITNWIEIITATVVKELCWQAQGSTIHQLCCTAMKVLLQSCVYAQQYHGKVICPVGHIGLRPPSCLELSMETLYQNICNGMVGCGANALSSQKFHQLAPQVRLKLPSLITCYSRRDAKTRDPATDKCTCSSSCFGSDVLQWKRLWPPCEAVYAGQ